TAEGLLVVDWKTGRRDEATERDYEEQVQGYLEGVAQAVAGTTLSGAKVEGLVVWLDEEPPFLQRVAPA
ncbi:hypothetical protein IIA16_06425, partial [bacterium]|nr:hypothetical protein [bacterium]